MNTPEPIILPITMAVADQKPILFLREPPADIFMH
jgi:hypothetical protein